MDLALLRPVTGEIGVNGLRLLDDPQAVTGLASLVQRCATLLVRQVSTRFDRGSTLVGNLNSSRNVPSDSRLGNLVSQALPDVVEQLASSDLPEDERLGYLRLVEAVSSAGIVRITLAIANAAGAETETTVGLGV